MMPDLIHNRAHYSETSPRSLRYTHTVRLHIVSTQSITKLVCSLHPDCLRRSGVKERLLYEESGRFVPRG